MLGDNLAGRSVLDDREIERIDVQAQIPLKWNFLFGNFKKISLLPLSNQARLHVGWVFQQLKNLRAHALRRHNIISPWYAIFFGERVVTKLGQFFPDVARMQWVIVVFALKVIPSS